MTPSPTAGRAGSLMRVLAALVLSATLAACGPGVGGTGTGQSVAGDAGIAFFGAQTAPVCLASDAAVPAAIRCQGLGTPTPVLAVPTVFVDGCHRLTLVNDVAMLASSCGGWAFEGLWGVAPAEGERYFGLAGPAGGPGTPVLERPSTLTLGVTGTALTVWLRDADGRTLTGPLTLAPAPATAFR